MTAAPTSSTGRDHGFHGLRVGRVVTETEDARSYVLDVPSELAGAFTYRPGQFCTFRVRIDGTEHLRCYSMSSAPELGEALTVTVKKVPGGAVSSWFHDTVAEGDLLEVTRPAGVFCLPAEVRPVVGFCGGSGITPVLSIAKSALVSGERPVSLLYANRSAGSVIFDEVLGGLQGTYADRLRVVHHADEVAGFLTPADVEAFVGAQRDADFFLCGPTPFMDLVETTLLDLGIPAERIHVERFGALPLPVAEPESAPADSGPVALRLIVGGKKHDLTYVRGDTVLEAARRGGIPTPYSCEAGNCATCMALLKQGSATMRANNALTPEEVDEGWILTCQSTLAPEDTIIEFEEL